MLHEMKMYVMNMNKKLNEMKSMLHEKYKIKKKCKGCKKIVNSTRALKKKYQSHKVN